MSPAEFDRFLMPPPPPRAPRHVRDEENAVDMLLLLTSAASQVGGDARQPKRPTPEPLDLDGPIVFHGVSELFW